jgi:NodT family efflux transporter outer membrane factor (OMF) lipoprotein
MRKFAMAAAINHGGSISRRLLLAASAAACAALASGCMVGPIYHAPLAPAATAPSYKEARLPGSAPAPANPNAVVEPLPSDSVWKVAQPSDAMLRGKWWTVFGDAELNSVEDQLDINNQTIKQYFENFLAARALIREARSQFYPTLTVGPSFNRSRSSSNLVNTIGTTGTGTTGTTPTTATTTGTVSGRQSTIWEAPADISWEPDLWGRIRSQVHADQYAAQVSAADLENEKLTEEATLAETFFELRGEDALQQVLNDVVKADKSSYDLTKVQYDSGIADQISVVQAETTLRSAEAAAINVGVARAQYEHAIALLIGKPASDFTMAFRPATAAPPPIPVGVPSQLLERRPDIAAAERTMAEANATIGVETAAYYPSLTLSASGGFESSTFKHWFDWASRLWSVGPSFSETVYDAGLRRATIQQYTATYNADVASYRQTVLTAFQQVEDYLAEVRILSEQIEKEKQATALAQKYLDLENDRYKTGVDPYLDVMIAETTLLNDQQSLVSLQIEQMTSAVSLVQALGGGWEVNDLPTPKQVSVNLTKPESTKVP